MKLVIKHTSKVWISNINPIAKGWFNWIKTIVVIKANKISIFCIISRNSLFKILILEINDKEHSFFLKF